MFLPTAERPKVGVAAIILKGDQVLMHKRIGAHGAGAWCFPGGHLEFNETFEDCAKRETREEAGVEIENVRFFYTTNDVMTGDDSHYVTVFMLADWKSGEAKVMEPDRATEWRWVDWDAMPEPVFEPVVNLKKAGLSPVDDGLQDFERVAIAKTRAMVEEKMTDEGTGHDWWHVYRVWQTAKKIAQSEGGNRLKIELAALLHDLEDFKFHNGDATVGAKTAREWLSSINVDQAVIDDVAHTLEHISYKGANVEQVPLSIEGRIVQDADRLDSIGAIGIARTFVWGGHRGRPIYIPGAQPQLHDSVDAYIKGAECGINHFHEKLLLIKDRLNTETAKKMAEPRHAFMQAFLEQFHSEWDGREAAVEIERVEEPLERVESVETPAVLEEVSTSFELSDIIEAIRADAEEKHEEDEAPITENLTADPEPINVDEVFAQVFRQPETPVEEEAEEVTEESTDFEIELGEASEELSATEEDIKTETIKAYDRYADIFDEKFGQHFADRVSQLADRFLQEVPGERMIDIGCGTGNHGAYFQARGMDVLCTDLSQGMLDKCREKGLKTVQMDMEKIDFPANTFDGVWAYTSLVHLKREKIPVVLDRIAEILKSGGIFGLSMKEGSQEGWDENPDYPETKRWFTHLADNEVRELVREKFDILEVDRQKAGGRNYAFITYLLKKK